MIEHSLAKLIEACQSQHKLCSKCCSVACGVGGFERVVGGSHCTRAGIRVNGGRDYGLIRGWLHCRNKQTTGLHPYPTNILSRGWGAVQQRNMPAHDNE